jgi:hypothetical protein
MWWVAVGPNNVEQMASLFEPEYYLSKESIRESIAHESTFNLIHHESWWAKDSHSEVQLGDVKNPGRDRLRHCVPGTLDT